MNRNKNVILIALLAFTLIIGIITCIYSLNNTTLEEEQLGHYNSMRSYYDSKTIPTLGAYVKTPLYIGDETFPRVPGGYFYIEYILSYILGGFSLQNALAVHMILMFIALAVFLFWVFRKFGFTTFVILTSFTLLNITFINSSSKFYNPYPVVLLSFFLAPLIAEYMNKEKSFTASILIFPVIALMAQAHLAVHFSMTLTMIIYLIIRWKKTKKNILGFSIGVFISFLIYLPYLLFEISNRFDNTIRLFLRHDAVNSIEPPQIYALLLFPTNEVGVKYAGGIKDIIAPMLSGNITPIYNFIFYILSILLSITAFVITVKYFLKRKKTEQNEKTSLLNEMFFFYLLYMAVSFIAYMFIFRVKGSRMHYFYSMFAFSYITVIYLVECIKNYKPNYLKYILIFIFLNSISVSLYIYSTHKGWSNNGWTPLIKEIEAIYNDAKGKEFTVDISEKAYQNGFTNVIQMNKHLRNEENKYLKYIIAGSEENIDTNKYINPKTIYSNKYQVFKAEINTAFRE